MTIGMTVRQGRSWRLLAVAATLGFLGDAPISRAADGPSIFNRKPSGPIFKTLDAFAGGIELVLEKTVLGHSKPKRVCDSQSCDDGCDAVMLHELNLPRGSKVAVPEAYPSDPPEPPMHSMPADSAPPMVQIEPMFDRPSRKPLPQPVPDATEMPVPVRVPKTELPPISKIQPPNSAPLEHPRVPVDVDTPGLKTSKPSLSTDDGWIDNFAPATPNPDAAPPRRAPIPDGETLPDPFRDDPQARPTPQRFLPKTHPDGVARDTRASGLKPVKNARFVRPD